MSELDETLQTILGNQEMMGQIMTLARSLSGEQEPPDSREEPKVSNGADLSNLLNSLDPSLLSAGMSLVGQLQGTPDQTCALLQALRPFLRAERQRKLDRALKLAPMLRVLRLAMEQMGEKGEKSGV